MLLRWIRSTLTLLLLASLAVQFVAIPLSNDRPFCLPDGRPNTNRLGVGVVEKFNAFAFPNLFTINLATGRLSFSIAKLIDVVWDVVVGRGGQALRVSATYTALTGSV
jgi:hypothetical protein